MKKSILLTGANGNIGSFIFKKLREEFAITRLSHTQGVLEENYFALDLTNELKVSTFSKVCLSIMHLFFFWFSS